MKKEAKKRASDERQRRIKTGDDPYEAPVNDGLLDKVAKLIPFSIEGMPSTTDSDGLPMNGEYQL
jgi:hypothetical protein